jgi:myo-inositol-hexaphosphate 3-phosphohydrolase
MAVAAGVGVHVGGNVNGAEVCGGWELAVGLPQAGNNTISNEAINKNFLLMEWRILQVLRLTIY